MNDVLAKQPAERVDDGAVVQSETERCDQPVEAGGGASRMMGSLDPRRQAKSRIIFRSQELLARDRQRAAQLREVLLVRELRRLVEPFRHQQLGGNAFAFAAVGKLDARAHEGLRRMRDGDSAEPERNAKAHRPLEKIGADQAQARRGGRHRGSASINPRM